MTNLVLIGCFTISFYCPCKRCSPHGITANQTIPSTGVTIAAPRNIPLGTRLYVQGLGFRLAEDRMRKDIERRGRIDVFYYDGKSNRTSHQKCKQMGIIRNVPVYRERKK